MNTKIEAYSLSDFQSMINRIYGRVNDLNYDAHDFVSRIHRDITRILKSTRKDRFDRTRHQLCMAFSWSLALANRLHINLDEELWREYPGACPYCGTAPCSCKQTRAADRLPVGPADGTKKPETLMGYQHMLAGIYPENTLVLSAMHLAEEAGEVDEALSFFMGTHDQDLFENVKIELIDVVANLCAVATCAKVDLADEMAVQFACGCPDCHHNECRCSFTTPAKSVSEQTRVA